MITISLDEYGEFEKEENKPLFIAGIVFDDRENAGEIHIEEKIERERIRAYYKKVISDAGDGFSYPQDLHSNGDGERDHNVIAPVKSKVAETLPEFIRDGTYEGNALYNENGQRIRDRKGRYHLFVMLKSDDGKKKLLAQHANMLAKDDWAANRYFHMAGSVVNRIIFHNPLYPAGHMPSVNIDIATRSTGNVDDLDDDLKDEFIKQAYRLNTAGNTNHRYYSIMNADIYRTLIAQEMVNSGNIGIKIEKLYVKSIQYDPGKQMMEFLYLSDSLCSLLAFNLYGRSADEWLEQILGRVDHLNPNNTNLVFGYDEIDNDFSRAWNCYENKNYFEALSITYDAAIKQGRFAKHYKDTWFPYLEERIKLTMDPGHFNKSVNELSAMLTTNNLQQEKLLYLMGQFTEMIPEVESKYRSPDMRSRVLYRLYDTGVSAFCHIGNAKKALEYYEKCKKHAFYAGVDAFLNTGNKLVVCLEDCFEWDKALKIAKDNVSNQELVSEMKREVLKNGDEFNFLDEAKALSQMARILAEKRDPDAETIFRGALAKLEHGSANYKITQSYLLHYYADMKMMEEFEKEATDYFDGKATYNQRLRYILNFDEEVHSTFSNEYALYVLIRGLFLFNQDAVDDVLWEKLCSLKETLEKKDGREPGGHPWEITYKYLEMFAIRKNDENARKRFSELKGSCLRYKGEIIIALDRFGDAEVAEYAGDTMKRDQTTTELVQYLKENFDALKNVEFSSDGLKRYQELEQYFTFMYR